MPRVNKVKRSRLAVDNSQMPSLDPDIETRRLAAVARLGVIGSDSEERFDRITRLASRLLGTPIALITALDDERQWFTSCLGLSVRETPRNDAFCAHAIASDDRFLVVEDATVDDRFVANPLVTGDPHIRFYAGRVICEPGGERVGTLCIIDRRPRHITDDDLRTLDDLAVLVEQEFMRNEYRATLLDLDASERSKARILESLTEGVVMQDADGRIVEWNPAAERVLGLSGGQLGGRTSLDPMWRAVHPDGSPWPGDQHPAVVACRTGVAVENQTMGVHRSDGSLVWLRVNAQPMLAADGTVNGVVAAFDDVTVQRNLQISLEQSEQAARASLDALEQGVILTAGDGTIQRMNPSAERLLGYSCTELTEMFLSGSWITYDAFGEPLPVERRPVLRARISGDAVRGETIGWRRRDGDMIILRASFVPDADGADGMLIAFTDVTAEQRMLADLTRFRYLFQNANDIITVVDETGLVLYASPSMERVLGYPEGWTIPAGILGMVHPDDLAIAAAEMQALVENRQGTDPFLVRVRSFDGEWHHIECVGVNLLDEPAVGGIVITARDATERQRLTEELAYRASHDELTGLPSRRMIETRLSQALSRAAREGTRVGLCFVDLDGFKNVNDTLGHGTGDQVLIEVAERISSSIRGGDMAARIGGDEFVVVLDPVSSEYEALVVARRMRDAVLTAIHSSSGRLSGSAVSGADASRGDASRAGVSFGASVGLAVSETGDTPASFLRRADGALYRAKETNDSSIVIAESILDSQLSP